MRFILREAFRSIGRTKLSFMFSLVSMALGVALVQLSLLSIVFSERLEENVKSKFAMNLFLEDGASAAKIGKLKADLEAREYVKSVDYISKAAAAEKFIAETGEDFRRILDYNPLPASLVVSLKAEYWDDLRAREIKTEFERLSLVDDVSYETDAYQRILSFVEDVRDSLWTFTALLVFVAFYIVYATLRLIMFNRAEEIETMKLVGGSLSTIKAPIIVNGVVIGLLANAVVVALFYAAYRATSGFVDVSWIEIYFTDYYIYLSFVVGPAIGLLGSALATRKISMKIG